MSVVLTGSTLGRCGHVAPAWWSAWSRMGWAHLVAVVMATLLMTVVDASIWVDKLDKPGVCEDHWRSAIGCSLMMFQSRDAGVGGSRVRRAAERTHAHPAACLGRYRQRRVAGCITVPTAAAIGLQELIWSGSSTARQSRLPPMWLALIGNATIYSTLRFLFVAVAEVVQRRNATTSAHCKRRSVRRPRLRATYWSRDWPPCRRRSSRSSCSIRWSTSKRCTGKDAPARPMTLIG